jgi:hypothetical protein
MDPDLTNAANMILDLLSSLNRVSCYKGTKALWLICGGAQYSDLYHVHKAPAFSALAYGLTSNA